MKKLLLATVATIGILAGNHEAAAQLATLPEQLVQAAYELQTMTTEISNLKNQIENTLQLPGTVYRDLTGDIAQLTSLTNQANMLAGNAGNMITALSSVGGYGGFTGPGMFHSQFTYESNTVSNALKTAAQAISAQNASLQQDAATLSALNDQALNGSGRQQSLQTIAGLVAQMAQSTQKLAQVMTTAAQGQMTYQLARQDQDGLLNMSSDRDLETAWVNACAMVAQAGGTSTACGGGN